MLDEICIVGGLVPLLLVDQTAPGPDGPHIGTNDLDVGLAITLLDDARYAEIATQLRQERFEPDVNANGNPTSQRWRLQGRKVTIDFLIAPPEPDAEPASVKHLLPDLGAYVVPGVALAFEERVWTPLEGHTLRGERARREIPVCGPGAFVVLKALAFAGRGKPKDVYDLIYLLRNWSRGQADVVNRLRVHAHTQQELVSEAFDVLARDFATLDSVGPSRAAEFLDGPDHDADLADAHGEISDLLTACRAAGILG
nr:nucleotidyl transferase AbiEii/AbiGii toxin family protein [Conexibacter arvalis]